MSEGLSALQIFKARLKLEAHKQIEESKKDSESAKGCQDPGDFMYFASMATARSVAAEILMNLAKDM